MRSLVLFYCFSLLNSVAFSQQINGSKLLDKAIEYHDPKNKWETFSGTFNIIMETPNNSKRASKIIIDLPKQQFYLKTEKDTVITEYTLIKDKCTISLNGKSSLPAETLNAHNLSCERAHLFKNYYTYLYGLPMKLKDDGTFIDDKVEQKTFKGQPYLVLKATYDASVGNDVWFFYFNPKTYAMEVYQFYKTNAKGAVIKNSGEYIVLTEEKTINGIKMPKTRAWYYNKNNGYLGTDILD